MGAEHGQPLDEGEDVYPFLLAGPVLAKMRFNHTVIDEVTADSKKLRPPLVSSASIVGNPRAGCPRMQRSLSMTVRRMILVAGAVLLLAGVIGLLVPVSISDSDGNGIGCGNAVAADTSSAQAANDKNVVADIPVINQIVPHADYVSQCQSSISSRRSWTIPLAIVGAIVVAASFFVRGRRTVGTASPLT